VQCLRTHLNTYLKAGIKQHQPITRCHDSKACPPVLAAWRFIVHEEDSSSAADLLLLLVLSAAGFNAVRVPMNFTNLQRDIPKPKTDGTEFYTCMVGWQWTGADSGSHIMIARQ
jgi:hypothetical protein